MHQPSTLISSETPYLDKPTSALGVKQAGIVLRLVQLACANGVAVVLVSHNAHHEQSMWEPVYGPDMAKWAPEFARGSGPTSGATVGIIM